MYKNPSYTSDRTQPFRIAVPQTTLDDLRTRLEHTRWSDAIAGASWDDGTDVHFLRKLVAYWRDSFDWRAQEATLNLLPQFRTRVGGSDADSVGLHFVHVRATQAERTNYSNSEQAPLAIVLLHGWPGLFYQMSKLVPLLSNPAAHGGDPADGFNVVVPSLPGFGFSDRPTKRGMTVARMAPLIDELMTQVLGYTRYAVAGGDIGAIVARQLAGQFPPHVVGVETNGDSPNIAKLPPDLSLAEQDFVKKAQGWIETEGAYIAMQATKPQTAAAGLTDSPAGLAAWLVEKYRAWSDCALPDGSRDVLRRFSYDELLTFIMIYWITETISSSIRTYYENGHDPAVYLPPRAAPDAEPPLANAVWPGDIIVPPREWSARRGKLVRYTVMPRGGHFPEWEEPQLVAEELRTFFRPLREQ